MLITETEHRLIQKGTKKHKLFSINEKINLPNKGLIFIMGENGSGKSTFLDIIGTYIKPDKGSINFDNEMSTYNQNQLDYIRKYIISYQSSTRVDKVVPFLNSYDNIKIATKLAGVDVSNQEIDDLLFKFNLAKSKDEVRDKCKQNISKLSSGERKKVMIAMAVLRKTPIMLFDEPLANISESGDNDGDKSIIFNLLKKLSEDHLIIVSSNDYKEQFKQISSVVLKADNLNIKVIQSQNIHLDTNQLKIDFNKNNSSSYGLAKIALHYFKKLPILLMYIIMMLFLSIMAVLISYNQYDDQQVLYDELETNHIVNVWYPYQYSECNSVCQYYDITQEELADMITEEDIISFMYNYNINFTEKLVIDTDQVIGNGIIETNDFSSYTLLEGRYPLQLNEVLLSDYLFNQLGISFSDNISFNIGNEQINIVGIYNTNYLTLEAALSEGDNNRIYDYETLITYPKIIGLKGLYDTYIVQNELIDFNALSFIMFPSSSELVPVEFTNYVIKENLDLNNQQVNISTNILNIDDEFINIIMNKNNTQYQTGFIGVNELLTEDNIIEVSSEIYIQLKDTFIQDSSTFGIKVEELNIKYFHSLNDMGFLHNSYLSGILVATTKIINETTDISLNIMYVFLIITLLVLVVFTIQDINSRLRDFYTFLRINGKSINKIIKEHIINNIFLYLLTMCGTAILTTFANRFVNNIIEDYSHYDVSWIKANIMVYLFIFILGFSLITTIIVSIIKIKISKDQILGRD